MNLTEISNLHLKTFNTSWDNYVTNNYTIDSLSLDKVIEFIEQSNKLKEVPINDDPLTVLTKFELIKDNSITNACHLLFSKNDVFQATIELGRFSNSAAIKDGLTIRSDLFSEVLLVMDFIRKHLNKEYIITGNPQREEQWQYPLDAIREIVVNMIVHRDYTQYGDSSIKIFNDQIEFFNPGHLPDSISVEQLLNYNYTSEARNKKVAIIFKEAGVIEKYGSGIYRIIEAFHNYGLKTPLFENFQNGFKVSIFSKDVTKDVTKDVGKDVGKELPVNLQKIFSEIKENPKITIPELSNILNVTDRTVERQISTLKEMGIIRREGGRKNGCWVVLDNNK